MEEELWMGATERRRLIEVRKWMDGKQSASEGAERLGLTVRAFRYLAARVEDRGDGAVIHGNKGKKSNRRLKEEWDGLLKEEVEGRLAGVGPTLVAESMERLHGIHMSADTVRRRMISLGAWQAHPSKRLRAHPERQRREREGELVQIDGSLHLWLEERGPYGTLLAAIDDATSKIMAARFVKGENTEELLSFTRAYIEEHGRPEAFYSDKGGVYRVNHNESSASSTGETQLGRALREVGIELIHAHSPQAKGRIERLFGTLQRRLVLELRLRGCRNYEEANALLPSFIEKHNARFAVGAACSKGAHRPILVNHDLDSIFCKQEKRQLSKALGFSFGGDRYQLLDSPATRVLAGRTVWVSQRPDGCVRVFSSKTYFEASLVQTATQQPVMDRKNIDSFLNRKTPPTPMERRRRASRGV